MAVNAQTKIDVSSRKPTKKKLTKAEVDHMRDKDAEVVKGIFRFYEVPGGTMSFVFKAYDGDHIDRYDMVDGQVYSVPLGVARHLNKNLWYPEYDYMKGEDSKNIMKVTKKVRRCGFQSLEFIDAEDLSEGRQPLIEVTNAQSI